MKQSVLRFAAQLWAMLAVLLLFVAAALPAHADDGDMDEITHYTVTVDTRADGSADITYELDWNVIGGSLDEPLTWVRIGLPNSHNDSLVNLTPDTVLNVSSVDDGGSFAKVDFINAYFPPDIAATIGAQSSVHFAFQVHQSHLFLLNEDGNADYSFTPGWFDDLCVDELTIRWVALDGIQADNDSRTATILCGTLARWTMAKAPRCMSAFPPIQHKTTPPMLPQRTAKCIMTTVTRYWFSSSCSFWSLS